MSLPQENATLVAINGQQFSEDAERSEADTTKWRGSLGAYRKIRRYRVTDARGSNLIVERTLILDNDQPAGVDIVVGDVLTFVFKDDTETGKVASITDPELPGHPLQTTRLILEEG